jgi:hypothetical protein
MEIIGYLSAPKRMAEIIESLPHADPYVQLCALIAARTLRYWDVIPGIWDA